MRQPAQSVTQSPFDNVPFGQLHAPAMHADVGAAQVFPHPPQLFASVCLSTHVAPHKFAGSHAQAPFWHV